MPTTGREVHNVGQTVSGSHISIIRFAPERPGSRKRQQWKDEDMSRTKIPLIQVKQWMKTWELASQQPDEARGDLPKNFFVTSMPIRLLRNMAGVSVRDISDRKKQRDNTGYQRKHQDTRLKKIGRYVDYGYPLSSQNSLPPEDHRDLIHPGWLPTAILVNIVGKSEVRRRNGKSKAVSDALEIRISSDANGDFLSYPSELKDSTARELDKNSLEPIEIIDGQHRLYAVDYADGDLDSYSVPVVIFNNLSLDWQAYLFWVINVEPKKINASLAFDLYPELRRQSWLQGSEWIKVYQEHRAQELTEALWQYEGSPWKDRIELHGNRVDGHVSNASFIRSLTASFVRKWGSDSRPGGLFGSIKLKGGETERVLDWKRVQQAALLIYIWQCLDDEAKKSSAKWVKSCESAERQRKILQESEVHPALGGPYTLLATDQGVRSIFVIFNALLQEVYDDVGLDSWQSDLLTDEPLDGDDVERHIDQLRANKSISNFLRGAAKSVFTDALDLRISSAPGLSDEAKQMQAAFRGSSGYSMLSKRIVEAMLSSGNSAVRTAAESVHGKLGHG